MLKYASFSEKHRFPKCVALQYNQFHNNKMWDSSINFVFHQLEALTMHYTERCIEHCMKTIVHV